MALSTRSRGGARLVRHDAVVHSPSLRRGDGVLDEVYRRLMHAPDDAQAVHDALDDLFTSLRERQQALGTASWRELIQRCRAHPLRGLLHEDPFTGRAFSKPRGYAGDAVLMDYVYLKDEHRANLELTRIGRHVFDYTTSSPAAQGVRARRGFLADFVDELACRKAYPEVLSLAAGHLREAEVSAAVKRRKLGRLVALDADRTSLNEIDACYAHYGVETVHARFRDLISNQLSLGQFDCVYATGLFDYLAQSTGKRLVRTMFDLLKPGGVAIVANFLQGIRDVGYMEAFMDWDLIYRTRSELIELTAEIPEAEVREVRLFSEGCQNIIFMELTKA